jgi:alkylmercury lyase
MSDDCTCTSAAFLTRFDGFEMLPHAARLLVRGRPVDMAELADAIGEPTAKVEAVLRSQPGTDWDEDGRLVGFGLTLRPTPHRFQVGEQTLYTWCATDTLFFPVVLGRPATVGSTCPATGQPVHIELSPEGVQVVDPAETVVSQLHLQGSVDDIRGAVCDHGHFFASRLAAQSWLFTHPDGQTLTVAQAFAASRASCETLGWVASTETQ